MPEHHRYALALVGCGDVGVSRHLPAVSRSRRVRLAAVCDADEARASAAAARFGAGYHTTDYRRVLEDPEVEAVVVATPPWVTPHVTMEALRHGKRVLCEKPMATSLEVARRVREVERESGGCVQVGFTYRHGPIMAALRGWIRSGRLGRPLLLRLGAFDETWDPVGRPEHYERIAGTLCHGPPCVHDGAHSADHVHFLTDSRAVRVTALGLRSRPEFPADNYNVALVELESGDLARLETGWLYPHLPSGEFEILGPDGLARLDRDRREATLVCGDVTERVGLNEDWFDSCFDHQLDELVRSMDEGRASVPGTGEGIASLELCKAIEEAMRRGAPVEVGDVG